MSEQPASITEVTVFVTAFPARIDQELVQGYPRVTFSAIAVWNRDKLWSSCRHLLLLASFQASAGALNHCCHKRQARQISSHSRVDNKICTG